MPLAKLVIDMKQQQKKTSTQALFETNKSNERQQKNTARNKEVTTDTGDLLGKRGTSAGNSKASARTTVIVYKTLNNAGREDKTH